MCIYVYFCSCVFDFVLLRVVHVNGCGVVMASCTPWYHPCSVVKLWGEWPSGAASSISLLKLSMAVYGQKLDGRPSR